MTDSVLTAHDALPSGESTLYPAVAFVAKPNLLGVLRIGCRAGLREQEENIGKSRQEAF
ncbi:MAG: hypothetical protein HQL80_01270 [Magnetococcales bacterium]|nr:hypothetical protein [Magnetococcales bacterium]